MKTVLWCFCHDGDRAEWSASEHTVQTRALVFASQLEYFPVGVCLPVAEAGSSWCHDATALLSIKVGVTAVQVPMWVATVFSVAFLPDLSCALLAASTWSGDSADPEGTGFWDGWA